jgi:competence protein ComEC
MSAPRPLLLLCLTLAGAVACDELLAEVTAPPQEERSARDRRVGEGGERRSRRARTSGNRTVSGPTITPFAGTGTTGVAPPPVAPTVPQGGTIGPLFARLKITFVDVGQGDAALLETADGRSALIDAGPPEGDEHLRALLAQRGIRTLDWMVLTHPHLDHIGGARNVLGAVRVQRVIDPAFPHPIATYDRLLAVIQRQAIPFTPARQGMTLSLGASVSVEVLQPRLPFIERSRSEANANSVVTRVVAGGVRVLFTGDAERETEERLLAENRAQLAADVLKVAHHGSRFASTPPFLQAVGAHAAVISCGAGNEYGHPHAETVAALTSRGMAVYRTDQHGDVELTTDGARYLFRTSR